ncbi:MAG: aluminum resistance family protein [Oscillatoriales cyanobacterium SM2_2_1]|nr:aluminum resistance family protein [Oscillatoriales cyanobacterium SM2_2_1]
MTVLTPELLVREAVECLYPIFRGVDGLVQQNLARVLAALRQHRVGSHHFADVSGYGHDDLGRQVLDGVFATLFGAEAAIARVQLVSGTHAIACCLYGNLRPGDELLSIVGAPYDTLEEVIGVRPAAGSLREWGVSYRELPLAEAGTLDWEGLATAVRPETRMVLIQRSCGYGWRESLAVAEIGRAIAIVKQQNPHTICFVDNCYGELVEPEEPTHYGADLVAGSLIKNLGGTIAPTGGYIAGKADYVAAAAARLTAPGIGASGGTTFGVRRLLVQGLFLAPQMVGEAIKSSHLAAYVGDRLGYRVQPGPFAPRRDVIQAIRLGSPEKLQQWCRHLQRYSPVDSYVDPVPAAMPGYDSDLIMAGGTFVDGSTSELSADGPLREPYILFLQGGTHWTHLALALAAMPPEVLYP